MYPFFSAKLFDQVLCEMSGIQSSIFIKQKNSMAMHAPPSVLNFTTQLYESHKYLQHLLLSILSPRQKSSPFLSPNTVHMILDVVVLNLHLLGCLHYRLLFKFLSDIRHPNLITGHYLA